MSLKWDTFVGEEITKKIIESLVLIMNIQNTPIQRKVLFIEAVCIIFQFYWDASDDVAGVSVICCNEFKMEKWRTNYYLIRPAYYLRNVLPQEQSCRQL